MSSQFMPAVQAAKMVPAFVYIAYATDDAAEVAAIADVVRKTGWSVCFGHLTEPGMDDFATTTQRLSEAACVLVVWSTNAANSSVVRSDALEAARRANMVLATLDDAAPLGRWPVSARLQNWFDGSDMGIMDAMVRDISRHAGPGPKGTGKVVPYATVQQQTSRGAIGGLVLVTVCLVFVAAAWFAGRSSISALPSPQARETFSGSSGEEDSAAARRWAAVPKEDLLAIRGFIGEHDGTQAAGEARRLVRELEQFAWQDINESGDLASQLEALTSFRIDFPDGAHITEAVALESERREALQQINTSLVALGLVPAGANDLATIRAGVDAFERSTGFSPSGRITEKLSASLAAAAEVKLGAGSH